MTTDLTDIAAAIRTDAEHCAAGVESLGRSIDSLCALVDDLRGDRAALVQLVREARELLGDRWSEIDLRDWLKAADAAITKAENRS